MARIRVLTGPEVKQRFVLRGEAMADWARQRGFSPVQVSAVIHGRNKGLRGKAHAIARELGMKPCFEKDRAA